MNDLTQLEIEVNKIIARFNVLLSEAKEMDAKRIATQNSSYVATQRENRLNERDRTITQREKEVDSQKTFIEEQNRNTQIILNKITLEKETLRGLAEEKREIEKEKLELEIDRKGLEGVKSDKTFLALEREAFEKEKRLFNQEKQAMADAQRLLIIREANIKAKEDKLDRIERMTSL